MSTPSRPSRSGTETPIIRELTNRQQVVEVAVSGTVDPLTLKQVAERVRAELTAIPEVTRVDIVSAPPYEISIEVSEDDLRRHGLTLEHIADAVRRSSLDLPGGAIRTERGEILLRTIGQAYRGVDFESLALWTRADGSRLELGDVATVVDGFEETDQHARFDLEAPGSPSSLAQPSTASSPPSKARRNRRNFSGLSSGPRSTWCMRSAGMPSAGSRRAMRTSSTPCTATWSRKAMKAVRRARGSFQRNDSSSDLA